MRHQIVVLGDRQRHTGDVSLLKSVRSKQLAADLPGDAHDGRGIHHRGSDPGDHVGRARAGGSHRNTYAAGRACVAVRHMRSALFVAHQNVANRAVPQRIVRRQNRPAWIAEDSLHALALQTFPKNSRSGHRLLIAAHVRFSSVLKQQNPPCQLSWRVGCLSLSNFVLLSSVKPSGQDAGKAYYYANLYYPQIVAFDHSILSVTEQSAGANPNLTTIRRKQTYPLSYSSVKEQLGRCSGDKKRQGKKLPSKGHDGSEQLTQHSLKSSSSPYIQRT